MAATQHLSKLNPNHPVHFQSQEIPSSAAMPLEKAQVEPRTASSSDESSETIKLSKYADALRETIFGTSILLIAGAYILTILYAIIRDDIKHNTLCDLHRRELRILTLGLMIMEGLMALCAGLGLGFKIRRVIWKVRGRSQTMEEWGLEVLAVLVPFYLGGLVGVVTLGLIGVGRVLAGKW